MLVCKQIVQNQHDCRDPAGGISPAIISWWQEERKRCLEEEEVEERKCCRQKIQEIATGWAWTLDEWLLQRSIVRHWKAPVKDQRNCKEAAGPR